MSYYKVTHNDPSQDGTTEVVLARDENTGEVTKVVAVDGDAVELNSDDRSKLEELGFKVETGSKPSADKEEKSVDQVQAENVGSDVAAAAPKFSNPTNNR